VSFLEDIREEEVPGKRGGDFFYAQVMYSHFDEIEKLKAEGFTLTIICKFLEKKGALPTNSDLHSFRRAFRREAARRQRVNSKEVNVNDTAKKGIKTGENVSKHEASVVNVRQRPEVPFIPVKPKNNSSRPEINPDNTFTIKPINPDDLPDVESIKK
jgi:2-keto-4-pentenoate hydratase/2-oxohepta-3-ene-1,7-dioic acid hydratase in catechol pathway